MQRDSTYQTPNWIIVHWLVYAIHIEKTASAQLWSTIMKVPTKISINSDTTLYYHIQRFWWFHLRWLPNKISVCSSPLLCYIIAKSIRVAHYVTSFYSMLRLSSWDDYLLIISILFRQKIGLACHFFTLGISGQTLVLMLDMSATCLTWVLNILNTQYFGRWLPFLSWSPTYDQWPTPSNHDHEWVPHAFPNHKNHGCDY